MEDKRQLDLVYPDPIARNTDPETSHMAADDARRSMSRGRRLALQHLYYKDMTDHELAAETGLQHNSIGKRRGDLVAVGYAEPRRDEDGEYQKRPAPSGSMAIVWGLTPEGRRRYETILEEE